MARPTTLKGLINGSTNAYLGNSRQRDTNARGNKFTTHRKQYYNLRVAYGLAGG